MIEEKKNVEWLLSITKLVQFKCEFYEILHFVISKFFLFSFLNISSIFSSSKISCKSQQFHMLHKFPFFSLKNAQIKSSFFYVRTNVSRNSVFVSHCVFYTHFTYVLSGIPIFRNTFCAWNCLLPVPYDCSVFP